MAIARPVMGEGLERGRQLTRVGKAEAWLLRVGVVGTSNDSVGLRFALLRSVRPGRSRETRLSSVLRTRRTGTHVVA